MASEKDKPCFVQVHQGHGSLLLAHVGNIRCAAAVLFSFLSHSISRGLFNFFHRRPGGHQPGKDVRYSGFLLCMIRRGYTKYPLFLKGNHCPNTTKVFNTTTEDYRVGHRPWLTYVKPTCASLKFSAAILLTKDYHRFVRSSLLAFLLQNTVILWILFPIRVNSRRFFQDYTTHNFTESSLLDLISLSYRKWHCWLSFKSLASHRWSLCGS